MVYISSDAVFDGNSEKLYTEADETNPINVYGRSKLKGEQYVLSHAGNLVLRTNIYGRNVQDKQSFGEWIYYGLNDNESLHMFTDIDFSPILVNELAEIIFACYTSNLHGLYHACSTGCITKYDFATQLKKICNIDSGYVIPSVSDSAGLKAQRSKHMGMSNNKICDALGMKISTPVEGIHMFKKQMEASAWR